MILSGATAGEARRPGSPHWHCVGFPSLDGKPTQSPARIRRPQLTWAVRPAQNGARSCRLRILPEPVLGSSSTKSTDRGTL
jgi:hypothetical protein